MLPFYELFREDVRDALKITFTGDEVGKRSNGRLVEGFSLMSR